MSIAHLPAFGKNGHIHVVIETPRGSTAKLKYDADLDAFTLSRPLVDGVTYPYDWGFVPSTHAEDGDPLDALVLWDHASYPGVVLACRPVALLCVEQNSKRRVGQRERNDRLIVIPDPAPKWSWLSDARDLPTRMKDELETFFAAAVALERKDLTFLGWRPAADAIELVRASSTDHVGAS